ncbi:MAG TPA: HAD-IIA family hydrolase [Sedimentisphaerales bacterium]|nr:HAD-IIA family hydrolase [Sedimentisphaerales bacterium]
MKKLTDKKGYICDMDGVIYHGNKLIEGAREFVDWLKAEKKQFVFLTNSSARSPEQLRKHLSDMGIEIGERHFMTSALATASFLAGQQPNARVYVIGESGLISALNDKGFCIDHVNPDYVIVGETRTYNYEQIEHAIRFVLRGAKLIGTNPDVTGPSEAGIVPACRALISPIEMATDRKAYFIGKPNPLIMRHAIKKIKCRREETLIIGDRMDTDIIAGIESEIETVLVLTGITSREDLVQYPYRPDHILDCVADIIR